MNAMQITNLRNTPMFWVHEVDHPNWQRHMMFSQYDSARRHFDYLVKNADADKGNDKPRVFELRAGNAYDGTENAEVIQAVTVTVEPFEQYEYATRNRPAGYGTVPEGWVGVSEKRCEATPYGTIAYKRKLTQAELYKWELTPISSNAYTYQVGDRVLVNDCDEATVSEHLALGRYLVSYDYPEVPDANVHVTQIQPL